MSEIDEPILRLFHVRKQAYRLFMYRASLVIGIPAALVAAFTLDPIAIGVAAVVLLVGAVKAKNYYMSNDPPDARY